jgi:pantothenate kinase-related protein Tda10
MIEMPPRSFHPPQQPEWHRRIAEAAYYLAQKRGFLGTHALEDWLAAEQQVRQEISPIVIPKFAATRSAGDGGNPY